MSNEVLQRFFGNIQMTHRTYARLLEVAERKQKHIVQNEVEELREDLRLEQELSTEGATLESQREALHARCKAALNLREAATLNDLCAHMPSPWKERFQEERTQLRQVLERLREVNRLNVALVNNSLELMKGLLAALFDAEPASAYERSGIRAAVHVSGRALNASV